MDSYNRGGHSKYSIKIHIIFVTKYRKKLFRLAELANDAKQFLYDTAKKYGYTIIQMETDIDHIHILLEYNPKVSVSEIIKQLKQYSTYQMWKILVKTILESSCALVGRIFCLQYRTSLARNY